jgi:two-component system, chemotaxis family, protein-glutamate methylesterase/glutaminase
MAHGRTRILIVDDSVVMRSLLRTVVGVDARLEVVATAADGESALREIETARPDLVLLDVEMPVMDGLETLRRLRARGHKMPVIMCSSLTQRGAKVTIEALAGGASDYVAKPTGQSGREAATQALAQDLIPKIHALTAALQPQAQSAVPVLGQGRYAGPVHVLISAPGAGPVRLPILPLVTQPVNRQPISSIPTVLAIGVSTGGPAALDRLLPMLPANFPLPVMIVQHMPEVFTKLFAERLNGRCQIEVREAAEGDRVRPGVIYIARGNWHMEVLAASRPPASATLHLNQGPLENHCRPAVDVLFRSVAEVYGSGVLAVVLTGMGSDGMIGCRIIREHGGSVLAQNQASSVVWGMPGAVSNAGLAHKVLPLDAIAPEILRIIGRVNSEARGLLRSAV